MDNKKNIELQCSFINKHLQYNKKLPLFEIEWNSDENSYVIYKKNLTVYLTDISQELFIPSSAEINTANQGILDE